MAGKSSGLGDVMVAKSTTATKVIAFLKSARWLPWLLALLFLLGFLVMLSGQLTGRATTLHISILGQSLTIDTGGDKFTVPINVVVVEGTSYVKTESGMIPLRLWLESIGFTVSWENDTKIIVAEK